ncbi:hypothetical protein [Roseibacillus persicicus]|uniref:Uncharacterized protein n=1 Tax=Roseibacillus persicicus TaxID=454148 RepID=A0A918TS01_9BACT|nr:hypothetical protein [Roseibacillus persicicus]MDQ8189586.1 hypothetical protein [Roseibacillus persicicus]GHC59573.1 hypothetical protein GCM10007100_28470 [Roseibacillus persicicus]
MKKLITVAPLLVLVTTSCQQLQPTPTTLPPVVEKAPTVTSKPTRSTRSSSSSKPKPSSTTTTDKTESEISPLTPDPTKVATIDEIPRFEVPDNVQPKVSDGINQGEFIELKW